MDWFNKIKSNIARIFSLENTDTQSEAEFLATLENIPSLKETKDALNAANQTNESLRNEVSAQTDLTKELIDKVGSLEDEKGSLAKDVKDLTTLVTSLKSSLGEITSSINDLKGIKVDKQHDEKIKDEKTKEDGNIKGVFDGWKPNASKIPTWLKTNEI
jgi:chromosome segregation ATPase